MRWLRTMLAKLFSWEAEITCQHDWRPAETDKGLARACPLCLASEPLTAAEFYAHFGELGAASLARWRDR